MVPTNWKAQCERRIREMIESGGARGTHILLGAEEGTKSVHQRGVRDRDVLTLLRAQRKNQFSTEKKRDCEVHQRSGENKGKTKWVTWKKNTQGELDLHPFMSRG